MYIQYWWLSVNTFSHGAVRREQGSISLTRGLLMTASCLRFSLVRRCRALSTCSNTENGTKNRGTQCYAR